MKKWTKLYKQWDFKALGTVWLFLLTCTTGKETVEGKFWYTNSCMYCYVLQSIQAKEQWRAEVYQDVFYSFKF